MKTCFDDANAVLRINIAKGICQILLEGSANELLHILNSSGENTLINRLEQQARIESLEKDLDER